MIGLAAAPTVLYSLGEIPTPAPGMYSLMPSSKLPPICHFHRCSLRMYYDDGVTLEHAGHEFVSRHSISRADLCDVTVDLWTSITAWIEECHQEEGLT